MKGIYIDGKESEEINVILNYEPINVMKYFEEICAIPHGSGNAKAISDYLMDFAASHDLDAIQDDLNNVIIFKKATEDKKDSEGVILQGHIDMVAVKEEWCDKNLDTDGLDLEVKDGFISAKGTSLGGDDGIAVAYAMAVLAADDISHPDITAIFTVDEEVGMLGAAAIDLSDVKSRLMLNIDSEDEGIFLISCAGGATADCNLPVEMKSQEGAGYEVVFSGFAGGHSGVEIHKNRVNTNVLSGRLMMELSEIMPYSVAELSGGEKDNAIAKITKIVFVIPEECTDEFEKKITEFEKVIKNEFATTENGMEISCRALGTGEYTAMTQSSVIRTMMAINYIPNGVQKMSADIEGLVQTSLNLGVMELSEDNLKLKYSVRSSVMTEKEALIIKIENLVQFLGGDVDVSGEYPAWEYIRDSRLREVMIKSYRELYGEEPRVEAVHAGLECGIMASKIENLDCVSFGPQMYDIHTTNERMEIKSVERTWKLLLKVLEQI